MDPSRIRAKQKYHDSIIVSIFGGEAAIAAAAAVETMYISMILMYR